MTFRNKDLVWSEVENVSYCADAATVAGYTVAVSLDDEGPLRPAYYWYVSRDGVRVADGWAGSVHRSRQDACREVRRLLAAA